jgi:flagellar motor switch protein FliG
MQPITPLSFPSADATAIDLTHKLRVAQHSWRDSFKDSSSDPELSVTSISDHPAEVQPETNRPHNEERSLSGQQPAVQPDPMPVATDQPVSDRSKKGHASAPGLDSTDAIHQHLMQLTPAELCQSLGKVETRDAMLALCGLPNQVTESVLAVLPRAHARKVRIQMNSLGSLHLREIDEAKERVAQASLALNVPTPGQVRLAA